LHRGFSWWLIAVGPESQKFKTMSALRGAVPPVPPPLSVRFEKKPRRWSAGAVLSVAANVLCGDANAERALP
jgi:hypothetical protein